MSYSELEKRSAGMQNSAIGTDHYGAKSGQIATNLGYAVQ